MRRESLSSRINKLLPDFLFIAVLIAALLYLAIVTPSKIGFGQDLCIIKAITHHSCPGCGLCRAFSALLHGDIHLALHLNPYIVIVAPILVYLIMRKVSRFVSAVLRLQSLEPGTKAPNN